MNTRRRERAFALPTVVITAVILMTLLVGGLSAVTNVRRALNEQYYQALGREAAEAGIAYAKSCIDQNLANGATTGWGYDTTTTLDTGDQCNGSPQSGIDCTGSPTANADQCYVYYDASATPPIRTKFTVQPLQIAGGEAYTIQVTSSTGIYSSSGTVAKSYASSQFTRSATDLRYGIASGNDTVCSVQAGKLYCWGKNDYGEVGVGTKPTDVLTPTLIQGGLAGKYVQAVATGIAHTCAIAGSAPSVAAMTSIYCWGANNADSRQYGVSMSEVYAPPSTPQITLSSHYATAISARDHTCILAPTTDNSAQHVYCWGENGNLQAGEKSDGTHPDPKASASWLALRDTGATTLTGAQQIMSISGGNTCGINSPTYTYVFCAGNGTHGMLGNNTTADSDRANWVQITSTTTKLGKAKKVVTNNGRACALSQYNADGATTSDSNYHVWCWGANWDYDAGKNDWRIDSGTAFYSEDDRLRAKRVHTNITTGTRTCVYDPTVAGGSYDCATIAAAGHTATNMFNADITDIAVSDWNMCVVIQGIVYCSGYNNYGQMGQGTTSSVTWNNVTTTTVQTDVVKADQAKPVFGALQGKTVVGLAGGNNHFCAITSDHLVYCWGLNSNGQIGDGTTNNALLPVRSIMPHDVVY